MDGPASESFAQRTADHCRAEADAFARLHETMQGHVERALGVAGIELEHGEGLLRGIDRLGEQADRLSSLEAENCLLKATIERYRDRRFQSLYRDSLRGAPSHVSHEQAADFAFDRATAAVKRLELTALAGEEGRME